MYCMQFSDACTRLVQACYGHTEGAAGLTGAFLAVGALANSRAPGIMSLREMNPYVAAALADWRRRSGRSPLLPRAPTLHGLPALAGAGGLSVSLQSTATLYKHGACQHLRQGCFP